MDVGAYATNVPIKKRRIVAALKRHPEKERAKIGQCSDRSPASPHFCAPVGCAEETVRTQMEREGGKCLGISTERERNKKAHYQMVGFSLDELSINRSGHEARF